MKIKVTVTITREMEINREYYPNGHTDEEILADEIRYSEDLFHEWLEGEIMNWDHKGEIIQGGDKSDN